MKSFHLVVLCAFLIGCAEKTPSSKESTMQAASFSLGLLHGQWERMNDPEGENTYEFWEVIGETVNGIGFTMVGGDTVFKEILAIVNKDRDRFYDVRGVNPRPTLFKFTDQTESTFVCVNDSNEFPKRIEYRVFQDSMVAVISPDKQEVIFNFKRVK